MSSEGMKPNPGGQSRDYSHDVIGRDEFAAQCWRTLEVKSLILAADRRTGKTWLLKKMGQEAPSDVVWLFMEVEKVARMGELLDQILEVAGSHLGRGARAFTRTVSLIDRLTGRKIGSFDVPQLEGVWKEGLSKIFQDLNEQTRGKTVVLAMDEFPGMLHTLASSQPHQAMELCDALRSYRQHYPAFRMIYEGSIGLHLVLDDLRQKGYRNEPFNDMEEMELPPLGEPWSLELARRVLEGAKIPDEKGSLTAALVREAACNPYYVHRLAFEMEIQRRKAWAEEDVPALLQGLIEADRDPFELGHYRNRIQGYYAKQEEQEAIYAMLDVAAESPQGFPRRELIDTGSARSPGVSRSRLGELVGMLERDHYLCRATPETCGFASEILRRWWLHTREGVSQR